MKSEMKVTASVIEIMALLGAALKRHFSGKEIRAIVDWIKVWRGWPTRKRPQSTKTFMPLSNPFTIIIIKSDQHLKNINMKTLITTIFAVLLSCTAVFAQDIENTPIKQATSNLAVPGMGSFEINHQFSSFKVSGNKLKMNQLGGTLTLPVINKFKDGKFDFLLVGVGYNKLSLSGTENKFGTEDFHTLSLPITFQKSISEKYALVATFVPAISSDFKDISGEDMVYSAAFMLKILWRSIRNDLLISFAQTSPIFVRCKTLL
jgi:hypothetical protein